MPHADTIGLSTRVGGAINRAAALGLLTNSGVAAADTLAGLDSFIAGVSVHADQIPHKARIQRALRADAGLTDAAVLGLTTTAGLAGLTSIGSGTNLGEYLD
jgi:hypothetical protein